jgi:hypothetical protein
MTPRRPAERVKNDRRGSFALARLLRAGEFTYVWVPDPFHEAIRDLVRARHAVCRDVRRARIRILAFPLRNDLRFVGKAWSHVAVQPRFCPSGATDRVPRLISTR